MPPPVAAKALTRRFDDVAVVDHVDLEVPEGRIQGFVGPSGSGKTTTVRMLTGALAPSQGRASVFGEDPRRLSASQRQRIGYMPQLGVLYPHLSVMHNLRFVGSLYGVRKAGKRIAETLEQLGLAEATNRRLRDCSGGMQRRVALAAALLHDPEVLFLDEPTTGLDPVLRQRLWKYFASLRDEGRTLFITTQIVSEAAMCDQVGLIADGTLLADDTPDALRRKAMGGEAIDIHASTLIRPTVLDELSQHPDVLGLRRIGNEGRGVRVVVDETDHALSQLREWLAEREVEVTMAERHQAPFDDVFVALLEREEPQS